MDDQHLISFDMFGPLNHELFQGNKYSICEKKSFLSKNMCLSRQDPAQNGQQQAESHRDPARALGTSPVSSESSRSSSRRHWASTGKHA